MIVAINGNRHQENHLDQIEHLVDSFLRRDDTVVMSDRFLAYLEDKIGPRFSLGIHHIRLNEKPRADLAIAIGGDGAFLKTAAWVGDSGIPVAGINTGHLGFLAAFSFDRPHQIFENLLTGNYIVEPRSVIEIETPQGIFHALNEVAITRGEHASMVTVETEINGHHSLTYKGDGLIIATPTGSTAYNLSVGGPILDPSLGAWVLSPIAAHSLSVRPLVISDTSLLRLRITLRADRYNLAIDGKSIPLSPTTAKATSPLSSCTSCPPVKETTPSSCTSCPPVKETSPSLSCPPVKETSPSLSQNREAVSGPALPGVLTLRRAPFAVNVVTLPSHPFTDTLRSKLGLGL